MAAVLATVSAGAIAMTARPAVAAPPAVAVANSMQQVRPTVTPTGLTSGASLTAAQGEYESFQLVVQGPATGISVTGDPFGWGTTDFYRVDYYTATQQSDREGGTGRWGDILVPDKDVLFHQKRNAFPFDVPSGENRVVWVDVFVPLGTAAGTYQGALSVASAGGTTSVPVSLAVLGFALPATSSLDNVVEENYDSGKDAICLAHTGSSTCNGNSTLQAQLNSLYARLALEDRVSLSGLGLANDQDPTHYASADWENTLEAPIVRGATSYPVGAGRLQNPRLTQLARFAYNQFHCQTSCATHWKAEATEAGQDFSDRFQWYGCDEAGNSAARWQSCANALTLANNGWQRPALATSTIANYTTYAVPTGIHISTLVPYIGNIQEKGGPDTRPDYNGFLSTAGNAVWLYTSCQANGCGSDGDPTSSEPAWDGWPSYAIDAPANQQRAMSWMAERYDASGELYYSADQSLTTAFASGGQFVEGANGDGNLFYPGRVSGANAIGGTNDIPLESIRLKRIRDGREDYEYMKFLRDHGRGSAVDAIVHSLYPTSDSATPAKDGAGAGSLLGARDQLISQIKDVLGTPSSGGRIAFTSNRDGDPEIYTMAADGTDVKQLTQNAVVDDFAAWSPDGTRIAFTRGVDVWVMNADGSGQTNLTVNPAGQPASKPAWSPDGTTIVYVQRAAGETHTDLYTMHADGTAKTPFVTYASGGIDSYDPAVSPGGIVYFTQSDGSGADLMHYSLAGTGFGTVTTGFTDEVADVAPNGNRLSFSRSNLGGSQPYDVIAADLDGSDSIDVTATAAGGASGNDFQSSYDPSSTRLAFASSVGGDLEIWSIDADGTDPVQLTNNTASDSSPDWGPAAATITCQGKPVTVDLTSGQVPTAGDDVILGSAGDDLINAGNGNDTVCAGGGDDTVIGGAGNDVIDGGAGSDTAAYRGSPAVTVSLAVSGPQNTIGAGTDTLVGVENLSGGTRNDTLTGGAGPNVLSGGLGDDTLNGGPGVDTVTYPGSVGVTVDLRITVAQNTIGAGSDTITNVENVTGSGAGDTLTGNTVANTLVGLSGDDTLDGREGSDVCRGGVGTDSAVACERTSGIP